jgi:hypothetical protein
MEGGGENDTATVVVPAPLPSIWFSSAAFRIIFNLKGFDLRLKLFSLHIHTNSFLPED